MAGGGETRQLSHRMFTDLKITGTSVESPIQGMDLFKLSITGF